jgi:hypothetical protein
MDPLHTPLFYIFLFIHIISFIIAIGSVITVDTFGLLWILKKVKLSLVNQVANVSVKLIWIGWFGLVCSGIVLITLKGFIDNLTWIKLFFVALVAVNGLFLAMIKKSVEKLGDVETLPSREQFRMTVASTISQIGWWGAFTIGFVHRHIQHKIIWPNNPWVWMVGILLIISAVILIGESVLRRKN